jgi:hypothetical protein
MERCIVKSLAIDGDGKPADESSVVVRKLGNKVSWNPIKAFYQGMNGEPDDVDFPLLAFRCPRCARVEFFAGLP